LCYASLSIPVRVGGGDDGRVVVSHGHRPSPSHLSSNIQSNIQVNSHLPDAGRTPDGTMIEIMIDSFDYIN
jgi:hypothetical protein